MADANYDGLAFSRLFLGRTSEWCQYGHKPLRRVEAGRLRRDLSFPSGRRM